MNKNWDKITQLFIILLVTITIGAIGYPQLTQTNDFQFHFNISKGNCIYQDKAYCDNYYLISKLFNFNTELNQYTFWLLIFLAVLPLLICKDLKDTLIFYSLVFSYNIIKASIYPQGIGLFFIYLFISKDLNIRQKLALIALSTFIHKYLSIFLLLLLFNPFIFYDKFKQSSLFPFKRI